MQFYLKKQDDDRGRMKYTNKNHQRSLLWRHSRRFTLNNVFYTSYTCARVVDAVGPIKTSNLKAGRGRSFKLPFDTHYTTPIRLLPTENAIKSSMGHSNFYLWWTSCKQGPTYILRFIFQSKRMIISLYVETSSNFH